MKKARGKRLAAVLMTLVMLLCLVPGTVNATEMSTVDTVNVAEASSSTEEETSTTEAEANATVAEVRTMEAEASSTETLTIVHTNDVHGHIEVEPYVKAVADSYKEDSPNGQNGEKNVITVSAGDILCNGRAIASLTEGESVIESMNAAGYDYIVPGNGDIVKSALMFRRLAEADATSLAANLVARGVDPDPEDSIEHSAGEHPLPSYDIFYTSGGAKIGVFGITAWVPTTNIDVQPYYYTEDSIETSKKCVQELQDRECDVIIGIVHLGWLGEGSELTQDSDTNSWQVANQVPGIDVLVDGHSHSIINDGAGSTNNANDTLVVQASSVGDAIGVVQIELTEAHEVSNRTATLLRLMDGFGGITPDSSVQTVVDWWESYFTQEYGTEIASTKYLLSGQRKDVSPDGKGIRIAEQNLGNLLTDALLASSDADVAMFPGFLIRSTINAGTITREQVFDVFSSGGRMYQVELTSKELWEYLENSIQTASVGVESTAFNQVSGLRFIYDPDTKTVVSVTMADGTSLDSNDEETTHAILYGTVVEPIKADAELIYDGYWDLEAAVTSYLKSDSYDTENYAKAEGRIIRSTDLYRLYYVGNDGANSSLPSDIIGDFSVDKGDNNQVKVTVSSDKPTRSGYSFAGWNDKEDGSGTSYKSGDEITFSENDKTLTLYAQWTKVSAEGDTTETLTIVHTNDVHGHIEVEPYVKAVADSYKANNPDGSNGEKNVITVSAGDVFAGGRAVASLTKGVSVVESMNAAGYDYFVPGNADIIKSGEMFTRLSEGDFKSLAANLVATGVDPDPTDLITHEAGTYPLDRYDIFYTSGGAKVGVFGIAAWVPDNNTDVYPYYYTEASIESARKCVEALKAEACDVIIGIAHVGWLGEGSTDTYSGDTNSWQIANQVPGIDVLVDGHTHSIINEGSGSTDNSNGTLVVQASSVGDAIGVVQIELTTEHEVDTKTASLLRLADSFGGITPDSSALAVVTKWENEFITTYGSKIASTEYFLNGERKSLSADGKGIRLSEQNLGNLLTDALLADTDADAALFPGFLIRASIKVGDITREQIFDVFSNGGRMYKVELTSKELWEYLEESIQKASVGEESTAFNQVSGLRFIYDSDTKKVTSVIMADGTSLDPDDEATTHTILYGTVIEPIKADAELIYDGYWDLEAAVTGYLKSDSYDTKNYAKAEGRIIKSTDLYGLYYLSNGGDDSSLPSDITGDLSVDKDGNNQVKVTVSSDKPARSGYSFTGWNDKEDGSGTSYKGDDEITFSENDKMLTLYAQWSKTPIISGMPDTVRVGDKFTLIPDPDDQTGEAGWNWDKEYFSATFNSPAAFTALKEGKTTITYTDKNGGTVSMEVEILAALESESETSTTDTSSSDTNGSDDTTDTTAKIVGNNNVAKTDKGDTSAKSSKGVKTGDATLIGLWLVLLLGSLSGITIIVVYRRRQERKSK